MEKIAVYQGSFDPPTNGHLDIIDRALGIFDKIIVAVIANPLKDPLFSVDERKQILEEIYSGKKNVEVAGFEGLLVDYVKGRNARVVLRGLRAVTDFEYEFQMAMMNRRLEPDVETVFLMTGLRWVFLSSSILKEAAVHGGDIEGMVPELVYRKLREKYGLG